MPPARRNRCVVLFDLLSGDSARKALLKIHSHQFFHANTNDDVGLILVNSDETNNRMNEIDTNRFLHILEVVNKDVYDPKRIFEKLKTKVQSKSETACSWIEAIELALEILKNDYDQYIINSQILFITDLKNFAQASAENLYSLMSDMLHNEVLLYIIGADVIFPKTITDFSEISNLMKRIVIPNNNKNLADAKQLFSKGIRGFISNVQHGIPLFLSYKKKKGSQGWNVPLTFHGDILFSVSLCKMVRKSKISLHSISKPKFDTLCVSVEDFSKVYDQESVRKGLFLHNKFVMIEDNSIFKTQTVKSLQVMFVTPLGDIPEHLMKGPTIYYVVPKGSDADHRKFHLLLERCAARKLAIITKRVYAKNLQPSYLAFVPDNKDRNIFIAIQLPYSQEVNFEWLEQAAASKTESNFKLGDEVEDFFQHITIGSSKFLLDNIPFTPNVVVKSENQMINRGADEYLKKELKLDEVDCGLTPTGTDQVGAGLRMIWPSREIENSKAESDDNDECIAKLIDSDVEDFF